ncbi:MAG: hypothetical protein LBO70_03050 [Clostridiales Family XIII bacterium]|nr:hypothetical protein [Clostridiales Family XIII bacterium]
MTGAYVKIGYFETSSDLLYQDEVHGPLITMADKAVDLMYSKYFKGLISYDGLQRIETYPVPRAACREAVLNTIVHRDYSTGVPIQIKVFPDEVIIYNDGVLPENWTVAELLARHRSKPRNPNIANAFFRSGQIETWGRGIEKMETACNDEGRPAPVFDATGGEIKVMATGCSSRFPYCQTICPLGVCMVSFCGRLAKITTVRTVPVAARVRRDGLESLQSFRRRGASRRTGAHCTGQISSVLARHKRTDTAIMIEAVYILNIGKVM